MFSVPIKASRQYPTDLFYQNGRFGCDVAVGLSVIRHADHLEFVGGGGAANQGVRFLSDSSWAIDKPFVIAIEFERQGAGVQTLLSSLETQGFDVGWNLFTYLDGSNVVAIIETKVNGSNGPGISLGSVANGRLQLVVWANMGPDFDGQHIYAMFRNVTTGETKFTRSNHPWPSENTVPYSLWMGVNAPIEGAWSYPFRGNIYSMGFERGCSITSYEDAQAYFGNLARGKISFYKVADRSGTLPEHFFGSMNGYQELPAAKVSGGVLLTGFTDGLRKFEMPRFGALSGDWRLVLKDTTIIPLRSDWKVRLNAVDNNGRTFYSTWSDAGQDVDGNTMLTNLLSAGGAETFYQYSGTQKPSGSVTISESPSNLSTTPSNWVLENPYAYWTATSGSDDTIVLDPAHATGDVILDNTFTYTGNAGLHLSIRVDNYVKWIEVNGVRTVQNIGPGVSSFYELYLDADTYNLTVGQNTFRICCWNGSTLDAYEETRDVFALQIRAYNVFVNDSSASYDKHDLALTKVGLTLTSSLDAEAQSSYIDNPLRTSPFLFEINRVYVELEGCHLHVKSLDVCIPTFKDNYETNFIDFSGKLIDGARSRYRKTPVEYVPSVATPKGRALRRNFNPLTYTNQSPMTTEGFVSFDMYVSDTHSGQGFELQVGGLPLKARDGYLSVVRGIDIDWGTVIHPGWTKVEVECRKFDLSTEVCIRAEAAVKQDYTVILDANVPNANNGTIPLGNLVGTNSVLNGGILCSNDGYFDTENPVDIILGEDWHFHIDLNLQTNRPASSDQVVFDISTDVHTYAVPNALSLANDEYAHSVCSFIDGSMVDVNNKPVDAIGNTVVSSLYRATKTDAFNGYAIEMGNGRLALSGLEPLRYVFTWEARVFITQNTGARWNIIWDSRALANDDSGLYLGLDSLNQLVLGFNGVDELTSQPITLNAWHHVAVVRNHRALAILLDGNVVAHRTDWEHIHESTVQCIGQSVDGYVPSVGFIEQIRYTPGVARYRLDNSLSRLQFVVNSNNDFAVNVWSFAGNAAQFNSGNVPIAYKLNGRTSYDVQCRNGILNIFSKGICLLKAPIGRSLGVLSSKISFGNNKERTQPFDGYIYGFSLSNYARFAMAEVDADQVISDGFNEAFVKSSGFVLAPGTREFQDFKYQGRNALLSNLRYRAGRRK